MQLLPGGPDIPNTVLDARHEGTLALVCGAGISKLNGLPLFHELVYRVWESLGSACLPEVADAVNREEYDRAMGYLEAHYTKPVVRQKVREQLRVPEDPDLATHRALLTLGKTRDGRLHIVTTNFDLLFEASDPDLLSCTAPTLPVPKPEKWDSLVYLHGKFLDREPDDRHLVITSADFGTAYLTERWASRFVSELFAHFTVLFVGYSVSDPVMRYLLDAIAAERDSGRDIKPAYVLAGHPATADTDDTSFEWSRKSVVPILYRVTKTDDEDEDHGLLHGTLRKWAEQYGGGLQSRKNVAYELGTKDPTGLSAEDISQLLWSIEDPDVMAHLAEMGTDTSLRWIDLINDHVEKLPPEKLSPREVRAVALVGSGVSTQASVPLGRLSSELARWMASHITDPNLVRWVLRKGRRLHTYLACTLQRRLDEAKRSGPPLPPAMDQAWRIILSDDVESYDPDLAGSHFDVVGALKNEPWGPSLRRRLLNALCPWLRVDVGSAPLFSDGADEQAPLSLQDLMQIDVGLGAGDTTQTIVQTLLEREDKDTILADLSLDLTALLRRALDAFAVGSRAGPDEDPGAYDQYSIAPHTQNFHFSSWTWLLELNRAAIDALAAEDRVRAHRIAEEWAVIEYPAFRRLALYAAYRLLVEDDS